MLQKTAVSQKIQVIDRASKTNKVAEVDTGNSSSTPNNQDVQREVNIQRVDSSSRNLAGGPKNMASPRDDVPAIALQK